MEFLIEALGFKDKRVTSIRMDLRWNRFAVVTVQCAPLNNEIEHIIKIASEGRSLMDAVRSVVKVEYTSPVNKSGMAKSTSGRLYDGPEEVAINECHKSGIPVGRE